MVRNFIAKRIENFITELKEEISQLDRKKINYDFLNSEEGFDLILKSFNSASRTRQREKIKLYAKILKNSLIKEMEFNEDEPELFLTIIEELSIREFEVTALLFKQKINLKPHQSVRTIDALTLTKENSKFNRDELVSILVRLEKTGLIKEHMFTIHGSGGDSYQINNLFVKLMNFIDYSDKPNTSSNE